MPEYIYVEGKPPEKTTDVMLSAIGKLYAEIAVLEWENGLLMDMLTEKREKEAANG